MYFSENIDHAKKQIDLREECRAISTLTDYPDWIIMEILASIIRTIGLEEIQSEKIISELNLRKITVTKNQIEYILNKYDLKKTLDSK